MSSKHPFRSGLPGGLTPLQALRHTRRRLIPLVVLALAPVCAAEENKPFPGPEAGVTPRPTHKQLTERQKNVKNDRKFKAAEKPIEMGEIRTEKKNLLTESTILAYNGDWTFVPKGSVIHLPQHLKDRISATPAGTYLEWKPFFYKNRGWLQAQNVTFQEALGESKIAEETVTYYTNSGRIVVAVCNEGPISVVVPKAESDAAKSGKPTTSSVGAK